MKILEGEVGFEIVLSSITDKQPFVINSYGGSLHVGLSMYDYVVANNIEVGCIGVCASAATLPLIASSKAWGTPNSRYLIHNPWTTVGADAESMKKTAQQLQSEQDAAVDLYEKHLTITRDEIVSLMSDEKFINAQEALRIGLIKEIREFGESKAENEPTSKMLYNQFKMKYMGKQEDTVTASAVEKLFKKVLASVGLAANMVVLTDVNGVALDFTDVESAELVKVGDKVDVDGNSSASGEYVMPSGETYVIMSGELTEIKEATTDENEDMEALKAENEALKAENEKLKSENSNMSVKLGEFATNLKAINAKITSQKPEPNEPVSTPTKEERPRLQFTPKNKKK